MDKDLYHPYINENGKLVHGPAALNHYIYTVKGGLPEYMDEVGEAYVHAWITQHSDSIRESLAQKARRDRFKVV